MVIVENPQDEELEDNLYSLYVDGSLSDILLRSPSGTIYPSHRIILASNSPFFRAMFISSGTLMKEGSTRIIDLPNINDTSLSICLEAIYKNDTQTSSYVNADNVGDLLAAASYLSFPVIRNACSKYLFKNLCLETVIDTLCLAEDFDCIALKEETVRYFAS